MKRLEVSRNLNVQEGLRRGVVLTAEDVADVVHVPLSRAEALALFTWLGEWLQEHPIVTVGTEE